MRTRWTWVIGAVGILMVAAIALSFAVDEPLRRYTERQMNAQLKGYTAQIGALDFHPLGLSIDFRDVQLTQTAHPNPPVLRIRQLSASVQWTAIIRGHVVADFLLDEPNIYVDRTQFAREMEADPCEGAWMAGRPSSDVPPQDQSPSRAQSPHTMDSA
jgi:hypothetical protein